MILLISSLINIIGQNYNNIANYYINDTPVNGVKIKTNLPFTHAVQMPYVKIEGYDFGKDKTLSLNLTWYVFNNAFRNPSVSSYGASIPEVWISNESGKVCIFLDEKVYYQRFTISVYAQGKGELPQYFEGWTVLDEALSGTQQSKFIYKNNFGGNVGIGTENPQAMLDVAGTIRAKEIKIEVNAGADHVLKPNYDLKSLEEVETFIRENNHLPEIPSEKQMQQDGLNINEFQIKLLQKIEELTLYVIELKKESEVQQNKIEQQEKLIRTLIQRN